MTDSDPAAARASMPSSASVSNATQPAAGPPLDKSVGAALALTFFFGPLGLFYINVRGAIIAIVVSIVVTLLTLGFGLLFVWPVTMVWAAVTASKKHQEFEEWKIGKLAGGVNQGAA
ncbi:MAG TPA: hypothetical protein VF788_14655 [Pseudonocardiaceae bacterium]